MTTWVLYWSPEGRPIATVQARTMKSAIRKAPKPYRKYLGEIYAVEQRPVCSSCGSDEGQYVPPGSGDAACLHCGADWPVTE